MCIKGLTQCLVRIQMVVDVPAGGCWGQVLPGRIRASGPSRDGFLVLKPLTGAEVRIRPVLTFLWWPWVTFALCPCL